MELFPSGRGVGIFRGASSAGLEFHADLTLAYKDELHALPMHGQFVLVELSSPREAVLGRVTAVAAQGRLTSEAGEEYGLRAIVDERGIPEDLREQYLRYRVDVRLLGVLRSEHGGLVFAPSQRRLPHVGAKVAFLPDDVLCRVVGGTQGAQIGFFALGEFIYSGGDERVARQAWMQHLKPCVPVRFAVEQLVARRTFVFARAGFGKSNLIKLLLSGLYAERPTIALRGGERAPVGTVVFDPDGEYFWPDVRGRPALCDVKELRDELVVWTDREPPSAYYGSFKAGGVRLDIRQLSPALVLGVALSAEQQSQQNVNKLKALRPEAWKELVNLIARDGNSANEAAVRELLGLGSGQDAELYAARSNMTRVVHELHDPGSDMLARLLQALRAGKLCVLDISRMRGAAGLALSGIILRHIFERNQEQFTKAKPEPIPTIAVVEEAQSVLGHTRGRGTGAGASAYEEWVKEGRKYSLGAVLVTQQPGAIPGELLSQGDSWFVFHLLSQSDLRAVKAANAHFSEDLLSSLLNEPLPGNGVFWSSVSGDVNEAGNAYPIPLRVLSFEESHAVQDPDGKRGPVQSYASALRAQSLQSIERASKSSGLGGAPSESELSTETPSEPRAAEDQVDLDELYRRQAIEHLREQEEAYERLANKRAIPWFLLGEALMRGVEPNSVPEREHWAFRLIPTALDTLFGPRDEAWHTERRPKRDNPASAALWVVLGPRP